MKEVYFLQCLNRRILQSSRVTADVSWMKDEFDTRLAFVTTPAEHSVIVAWTSSHGKALEEAESLEKRTLRAEYLNEV